MAAVPAGSVRRATGVLGAAIVASNAAQVLWLALGRHAFGARDFGFILAAQSLYGVLQIVLDNGAMWEGARQAAAGTLTSTRRIALVRARFILALLCVATTVIVGTLGDVRVLVASGPFMVALVVFALLNVWEPLGHGRMAPYATYVAGRSAALGLAVLCAAAAGVVLPIVVPGLLECVVIVLAAVVARQPRPTVSAHGERLKLPWASIWRIGAPAVVSQYNYAIGTVVLGVTGRAVTAALAGVSIRLVSGLGGVQGALSTAIFPRLARTRRWQRTDAKLAGIGLAAVVVLAMVGLAVMVMIAPAISAAFLGRHDASAHAALIIAFAGAAGAGVTVQLTFILVAVGGERLILRASAAGAIVLTAGTVIAVVLAAHPAVGVAAAFTAGEAVTALMLARLSAQQTASPRWALSLVAISVVTSAATAIVSSAVPAARIEVAAGLSIAALGIARFAYARSRVQAQNVDDATDSRPQSRVAELVER